MNDTQSIRQPAPRGSRVESVDLLKGWAVIVMIETHVVNATVTQEIGDSGVFQWLKFFNGLVAPSFLFASGMAYAVTTRRKVNDYLTFGKPLFRQLGRLLLILMLGYLLHLPKFSFARLREGVTGQEWLNFLQADILQCIAVSLLIMQILLLVLRSERRLYAVLAVLTPLVLVVTPLCWGEGVADRVPAPLAAYINGLHFSLFPLFPWSVFLFSGALLGHVFSVMRESSDGDGSFMKILLALGLGLIAGSFLLNPLMESLYTTYDYWRFGPPFVLLRLGIVVLMLSGMAMYERHIGVGKGSVVTLLGRESLLVYTVHLLLIYGDFGTYNFRKAVNHTYGYGEAAVATLALLFLMYGLAFFWSTVKRRSPRFRRAVTLAVPVAFLLVFLFGPGE